MRLYKTVLKEFCAEFEIKKSRFISYIFHIESEEQALEKLAVIKKKHYDATHNVSAYITGENNNIQRFDDDGEPSKTAGVPILEVLKKNELRDVLVVTTRYFGGIKLGAGGLIRAYAQSASEVLLNSEVVEMRELLSIAISYDYTHHGRVENYLRKQETHIESLKYLQKVQLNILDYEKNIEQLKEDIMELTAGTAEIEVKNKCIRAVYNEKIYEG